MFTLRRPAILAAILPLALVGCTELPHSLMLPGDQSQIQGEHMRASLSIWVNLADDRSVSSVIADVASVSVSIIQGNRSQEKVIDLPSSERNTPHSFDFIDLAPSTASITAKALDSSGAIIGLATKDVVLEEGKVNRPALTLVIKDVLSSLTPTITLAQSTVLVRSVAANYTTPDRLLDGHPRSAWQSTNYIIPAGKKVTLEATGSITSFIGSVAFGPTGYPNGSTAGDSYFLASSLPACALIAKRNENGAPFVVGNGTTFTTSADTVLHLAVNDSASDDNTGFFDVKLSIESP